LLTVIDTFLKYAWGEALKFNKHAIQSEKS